MIKMFECCGCVSIDKFLRIALDLVEMIQVTTAFDYISSCSYINEIRNFSSTLLFDKSRSAQVILNMMQSYRWANIVFPHIKLKLSLIQLNVKLIFHFTSFAVNEKNKFKTKIPWIIFARIVIERSLSDLFTTFDFVFVKRIIFHLLPSIVS